jgi:DNA-binding beta-propeller fold protein YncE
MAFIGTRPTSPCNRAWPAVASLSAGRRGMMGRSHRTLPRLSSEDVPMIRPIRLLVLALLAAPWLVGPARAVEHRLYVAEPGIRDYLEYGGHGLLVFDADHDHKFVRRIPTAGLDPKSGKPLNVKGVCASAATGKVHISTTQQLMCLDLLTEKVLWEKRYDAGCDRMALSPDGKTVYLPSFEGPLWYVVDALTGDEIARIEPKSGAHNTIYGPDGKEVYLAGLKSPLLTVADATSHTAARTVGPFSAAIRPFTINGRQTLVFVNVNERLGFEVGDLKTGKKLAQVDVAGYTKGPVKRHGCPSHGIGLTPDEKELWVVDGHNQAVHIFDATIMPPKQVETLKVRDEPGWITFSIDGRLAYPSTGEVIDVATRKTLTTLTDEEGRPVMSEKMVPIDFEDGKPVRAGNQFGLGQVGSGQ